MLLMVLVAVLIIGVLSACLYRLAARSPFSTSFALPNAVVILTKPQLYSLPSSHVIAFSHPSAVLVTSRKHMNDAPKQDNEQYDIDLPPDPDASDAYAYQKKQLNMLVTAGYASGVGGVWHDDLPATAGDGDVNDALGQLPAGLDPRDPLTSGIRTGITSTARFMEAAQRHRMEREERQRAAERYQQQMATDNDVSSGTGSGAGSPAAGAGAGGGLGIGMGDRGSTRSGSQRPRGAHAPDDDDEEDEERIENDRRSYLSQLGGRAQGGKASSAGAGKGKGASNSKDDKDTAPTLSASAAFAAEADPDGMLDRRLIKKLASEMENMEGKRRAAEQQASTAKGKLQLQKAMQRRASLARLMTGIAINPVATFANGGKGDSASAGISTAPGADAAAAASASAVTSSGELHGHASFGGKAGGASASSGLAVYTTRPRLR